MVNSAHILVVDDDRKLRELLKTFLENEGFKVTAAQNAKEAAELVEKKQFDLMVLDVMMPGKTGMELTAELRASHSLPILMLTAMGEAEQRILGLEKGADDYLAKPFEPRELSLRIQNLIRRNSRKAKDSISFGEFRYSCQHGELLKGERAINLTSTEQKLMNLFTEKPGQPISREVLSRLLHGISERSVDVQITRLRKKIETDPKNPKYLQTARGSGYVLREKE